MEWLNGTETAWNGLSRNGRKEINGMEGRRRKEGMEWKEGCQAFGESGSVHTKCRKAVKVQKRFHDEPAVNRGMVPAECVGLTSVNYRPQWTGEKQVTIATT